MVAVALFSLVIFCFEALAAIPVLAAQRCIERRELPQQAEAEPNPVAQVPAPIPRQESQIPFQLPEIRLQPRVPDARVVRAPQRVQPAPPPPEAIPEEVGAQPVTQEEVADVLGYPFEIRFPADAQFYNNAVAGGMETLPEEKQVAYQQLIANPRGPAGEVDPHEWVAACSIAQYLIFKKHALPGNTDCPGYLARYEINAIQRSKTLVEMSQDFYNLNPAGGQRSMEQYADQAGVLIKLRNPKRPVALSLQARQLVHAANVLAQKIGTDRFIRNQIFLH
jgi:hypothetical protein